MNLKKINPFHAIGVVIGVWFLVVGVAGLMGYDLRGVFDGILW